MGEQEKALQTGELAQQYGTIRGELAHLNEKLARAARAFQFAGQNTNHLGVEGNSFFMRAENSGAIYSHPPVPTVADLVNLLNAEQLREVLLERKRLEGEANRIRERLNSLAPGLLQ